MSRKGSYEPRTEIARMKSFNGEKGIYSYHVKWSVGKLSVDPDIGFHTSGSFKTNVSNGYSTSSNSEQEWCLQVFMAGEDEEQKARFIELYRSFNDGEDEEVPVIARVKLMNETKGIVEFSSSAAFLLASINWSDDWRIPEQIAEKSSKNDHYVVHCWMDIPKSYDGVQNYVQNFGPTLVASSLARSFEKAISKDGDPTSDIELVIKDDSEDPPRFHSHRLILASRSPVFEMMFTNDRFKESNERIVEIEDMDGETLKLLLEYLYTGGITKKLCDAPKELIYSILNAAEKYMLPELKDECALALVGSGYTARGDSRWIECLPLADTFGLDHLRKVCLVALSTNLSSLGENVRATIPPRSMTELLNLATKRGEFIKTIEVKTAF